MKFILLLGFVLGLAVALEPSGLEGRARRQRRTTTRPRSFSGSPALRMPTRAANAPSDYEVTVTTATRPQSKEALKRIPAEFMHPAMRQRRESFEILRKMRRQALVSDFFECTNPNPSPSTEDCDVIVDQLLSSSDGLVVTANACLVFSYRTCQGFFCSLCQTLSTTTDFIGSQLDTVNALCVENGQAGTIVGEDPPQWDAGFTYAGEGLPTYDVC